MNQTKLIRFAILGVIILMVLLIFSNSTFVTINSGERGVQFKKFAGGLDKENTYDQGFHFVLPWNEMIKYEVREQIQEEAMDVILGEGLGISMDVAVRFRPIPNKIGYLHDELGPNYKDIVVKNAIRSAAREVASKFAPEEVYSTKKDEVRILIEQQISPILQDRYLELIRVDIRDIKLPPAYKRLLKQSWKENKQFKENNKRRKEKSLKLMVRQKEKSLKQKHSKNFKKSSTKA